MNNDSQKANAPSSARRRLVRGAFSAPAVLTLYSGSALATASLTCRTKAFADQATVPISGVTVPTTGIWLRVQAYKRGTIYYIKGSDVKALATSLPGGTGSSYLSVSLWQDVTTSGYPTVASFVNPQPVADAGKFVAMKINAAGGVVGFSGSSASNYAMMSIGCWSSIVM